MNYPRGKYISSKKINGIDFDFYTSDKPNKKYMAVYVNPSTNRIKIIHFGQLPYEHYYDSLSNVYQDLWHLDPQRRQNYRARHAATATKFPSASYLSYHLLW